MKITDEQLSAFLDAELPEAEMEMIREQLALDEKLADRLAELAMVDEVVAVTYSHIDSHPLPKSITQLLADQTQKTESQETETISLAKDETKKTNNVIAFPGLQTFQAMLQKNIAIAASVVMVLGLGAIQILHQSNSENSWDHVAKTLETSPSGVAHLVAGMEIKPRLTFTNKQGEYCRQFNMADKKTTTENIACRKNGEWQIAVSITLDKSQEANNYQPASGGSLLDSTIEDMASGDFFDAQDEATAIEQHWSKK